MKLATEFKTKPKTISLKNTYITLLKYKNAQKKLFQALGYGLKYFKFLNLESKLSLYDRVIKFFNTLYKNDYKVRFLPPGVMNDVEKHMKKELRNMMRIRGVGDGI